MRVRIGYPRIRPAHANALGRPGNVVMSGRRARFSGLRAVFRGNKYDAIYDRRRCTCYACVIARAGDGSNFGAAQRVRRRVGRV